MNDLAIQVLAGLISGLLLLLIQPWWIRGSKTRSSSTARANQSDGGGNQAVFEGNIMTGDVFLDQRYIDNSRSMTITTNINNASSTSTSEDAGFKFGLFVVAAIGASALLVLFFPILQGIAYGSVLAIGVKLMVAIVRTSRAGVWTARAGLTTVVSTGSAVVAYLTWSEIGTFERDGLTLVNIASEVFGLSTEDDPGEVPTGITSLENYLGIVFDSDEPAFLFVLFLPLAAVGSFALIGVAWLSLLNWHAYLRFEHPGEKRRKIIERARAFNEGCGIRELVGALLLALVAISCAHGWVYDLFQWVTYSLVS